ncbi:L,D-transpeptidase [Aestuariivirga sp.]|uniref:L,D-transpeptidase n=1 Tax=Aestuariivirga sp. TaxID=2650926 RepID=UPI003BABF5F1
MKKLFALLSGLVVLAWVLTGAVGAATKAKAPPEIEILIDVSNQSMTVDVNGWPYGRWKVSTARDGYHTPRGSWRPFLLKKMHYSKKYDNSPMPNSIFFLGGYAIHATYYVRQLGSPASHGCIRLHPQNAARLYSLVQKHGMKSTRITIIN